MFVRLLKLPDDVRDRYDLTSLRNILHGAAPCPPGVKQRSSSGSARSSTSTTPPPRAPAPGSTRTRGSRSRAPSGRVEPDDHIMIGDDDGNELPRGRSASSTSRRPTPGASSTTRTATKTESAYRGDYFTLGDVGYVDDDGFLFLTDRSANLIISGGMNIYPAEVDAVLLDHPAVRRRRDHRRARRGVG